MDDYVEALFWHADKFAPQFAGRQVDTVYFGGGTPSLLGGERLTRMLGGLHERFAILPDAEITVECNPDSMTDDLLSILKDAGVNRLSVGVQSAHDDELRMLGRRHTFAEAQSAIRSSSSCADCTPDRQAVHTRIFEYAQAESWSSSRVALNHQIRHRAGVGKSLMQAAQHARQALSAQKRGSPPPK